MLNSLLTNRYLLNLIKEYVEFQYENNTHIGTIDGVLPTYTYSFNDDVLRPNVIFKDNAPNLNGNSKIFKNLVNDNNEYKPFVLSIHYKFV